MGELKRSLLRSSDSLQMKTKRVNRVWQHLNTHRDSSVPLYLLGKLGFIALIRNLESVFHFFLTFPSYTAKWFVCLRFHLLILSATAIALITSLLGQEVWPSAFQYLLCSGSSSQHLELCPWSLMMEVPTPGSWPCLRHLCCFILLIHAAFSARNVHHSLTPTPTDWVCLFILQGKYISSKLLQSKGIPSSPVLFCS